MPPAALPPLPAAGSSAAPLLLLGLWSGVSPALRLCGMSRPALKALPHATQVDYDDYYVWQKIDSRSAPPAGA